MSLKHLAIIMDGNGRWAKSQGISKIFAYRKGAEASKNLVKLVIKYNIPHLTLFAFSSENWNRPQEEVNNLLELLTLYLDHEVSKLHENNIRLKIIGDFSKLSPKLKNKIKASEKLTANNSQLNLYIAFSYGGRAEIINACKQIVSHKLKVENINETTFSNYLYSPLMPDVDLLIRTSGELRISNFLLWQLAYSEFYFTSKHWPDFNEEDLKLAIDNFNQRQRNFGGNREKIYAQAV